MKGIAGTDSALYVLFLKHAALFFLGISVINLVFFLPLYATGYPIDANLVTDNQGIRSFICRITALNISGSKAKLTLAFTTLFAVYTVGSFAMLFSYWKKSMEWSEKKHSHEEKFLD
jgi:hypothetical protein